MDKKPKKKRGPMSEKTKAKMSDSLRAYWAAHPEMRVQVGDAIRARGKTPEHRRRLSESLRGRPRSPESIVVQRQAQRRNNVAKGRTYCPHCDRLMPKTQGQG